MKKRARISSEDRARLQTENRYRLVFQIETLVAEFTAQRSDMVDQVTIEENRSKQADPKHFAYSPLATSLRAGVENLDRSIADLASQVILLKDQIPSSFRVQPVKEGSFNFPTLASQMHPDVGRPLC